MLRRFPPGLTDPQQNHMQSHLTRLICAVLNSNKDAYYYQGFHDISLTFLLVCMSANEKTPGVAAACLNKLMKQVLAPFMEKSMEKTHQLIHVVFSLVEKENKRLFERIVRESRCPVAFCLAWVITWFSHTLPNESDVFSKYDYLIYMHFLRIPNEIQ